MYDYTNGSESVLIRRAQRGDVKAFSALYARIYKDLYKMALYTLKHPQDAEDAVGDAVVAAFENIHKLKKEEAFRSWMFTILANRCRKFFTTAQKTVELPEDAATEEKDFEQSQDVQAALRQLSDEDRMIILWSVLGGYAGEEIGQMLEMNPATVRSRKSRALEKMRQILQ